MKGEIDQSTIIFGDFHIPFLTVDRTTLQKISKDNKKTEKR